MEVSMLSRVYLTDGEFLREIGQALGSFMGDDHRFGQFVAPVVAPDAEVDMEGHPCEEFGGLAWAQADGPLTPVRRIPDTDRVADSRILLQPMGSDHTV